MSAILFSQALDADGDSQNGITHVVIFAVASLTIPVGGITQVRVTFEAGSTEACTITNAYIGHAAASGDVYDFLATPAQFLFGGATSKAVTAGTSFTSDFVNFKYNKTSALLISFYCGGGSSSDMIRRKGTVTNVTHYTKTANDAATVDKTGYTVSAVNLVGINKIEVVAGGVPLGLF